MRGNKNNIDLFNNLLKDYIPSKIEIYVEPFSGTFGLFNLIRDRVNVSIYNDINPDIYNEYNHTATYSYNMDYKKIIDNFNTNETFFYIDPPYHKKEYYYDYTFKSEDDHIELFNIIKEIKGNFLLSYDKTDFILDLYKDYTIYKYNGLSSHHQNEIIITNVKTEYTRN